MLLGCIAAIDGITRLTAAAAAVAAASIFIFMLAEIFTRNVLGRSLLFTWEFSSYLLSATIFLGAANAARLDVHVRVGLAAELLSRRISRLFDVVWLTAALVIALVLLHSMGSLMIEALQRGIVAHTPTETPLVYPYAANTIGVAILALQIGARLLRTVLGLPVASEGAGSYAI
jgi:TRAP-type C4-dicarboxylate transport system permease small subunit